MMVIPWLYWSLNFNARNQNIRWWLTYDLILERFRVRSIVRSRDRNDASKISLLSIILEFLAPGWKLLLYRFCIGKVMYGIKWLLSTSLNLQQKFCHNQLLSKTSTFLQFYHSKAILLCKWKYLWHGYTWGHCPFNNFENNC